MALCIAASLIGLMTIEYASAGSLERAVAVLLVVILLSSAAILLFSSSPAVAARASLWSALAALTLAVAGALAPLFTIGGRALLSAVPLKTVVLAPLALVPTLLILLLYGHAPQFQRRAVDKAS